FFISWLANFKLLLFAFGMGPISDPSLALAHFVILACFPIKVQQNVTPDPLKCTQSKENMEKPLTNGKNEANHPPCSKALQIGLKSPMHYAKKASILAFILCMDSYRLYMHPDIILILICIYVYVGLEVMLAVVAMFMQMLLNLELEPPFDDPHLSSSLQDFWGRRWNRMVTSVLRSSVYDPILHLSKEALGHKWAPIPAVLATFLVSAFMHQLVFYHLGHLRPTWGTIWFFLIQGLSVLVEGALKKKFTASWRLPRVITGPLAFGFVIITFMRLVLHHLVYYKVDVRLVQEYVALGTFVKDLGMALKEWVHQGICPEHTKALAMPVWNNMSQICNIN
ncbi:unnamed protein product, partial [Ilex paraguariensis]